MGWAFHHLAFSPPVLRHSNSNLIEKRIRLISPPLFGSWEKGIREQQQDSCLHAPTESVLSTCLTKATLYTAVLLGGQFLLEFFAQLVHILNHFLFHIWSKKIHVTSWFLHGRLCLYQVYRLNQFRVSKNRSQPGFVVEVCFLPIYIIWKGLGQVCSSMILKTFCTWLNMKILRARSLLKTCLFLNFIFLVLNGVRS